MKIAARSLLSYNSVESSVSLEWYERKGDRCAAHLARGLKAHAENVSTTTSVLLYLNV